MIQPYSTISDDAGTWGLHRWKDGFIGLCKLHRSGEWFLVRQASEKEQKIFAERGTTPGTEAK